MLKGAILRQIRLCRITSSSNFLSAGRPAIAPARQWNALAASPSLLALPSARRGYQSAVEQPATTDDQPRARAVERITKFSELSGAGVHPNLELAITKGMGYDDMTQVQSMTLNAALAGKDMFVALNAPYSRSVY